MAATCSPLPPLPHLPTTTPQSHTARSCVKDGQIAGETESGLPESRGLGGKEGKEVGTLCYSIPHPHPQVPDVTLFNDIIMTVLWLPLAFSLVCTTTQAHEHPRFLHVCRTFVIIKMSFMKDSLYFPQIGDLHSLLLSNIISKNSIMENYTLIIYKMWSTESHTKGNTFLTDYQSDIRVASFLFPDTLELGPSGPAIFWSLNMLTSQER